MKLCNDDSGLCIDDLKRLSDELQVIVKNYYGLIPQNLDPHLYRIVIKKINDVYSSLTFSDLDLAYSEATIIKKEKISLTRDELLSPVALFWQKKAFTLKCLDSEFKKHLETENEMRLLKEFETESIELYNSCLETMEWTGTVFQASVIAEKHLLNFFSDRKDLEQVIYPLANQVREKMLQDYKEDFSPKPTRRRTLSQAICIEACKRGYKIEL